MVRDLYRSRSIVNEDGRGQKYSDKKGLKQCSTTAFLEASAPNSSIDIAPYSCHKIVITIVVMMTSKKVISRILSSRLFFKMGLVRFIVLLLFLLNLTPEQLLNAAARGVK